MWVLLVIPVVVIAAISIVGIVSRPPPLHGAEPEGLRSVVTWRDEPGLAADIAGDPHEQLRQLAGMLAERRYVFSCSIDRLKGESVAHVDVRDIRLELHARPYKSGWILWVAERGGPPSDSDDLRQLLSGVYRTLEERKAEAPRWFRREGFLRKEDAGAPSPFYVG